MTQILAGAAKCDITDRTRGEPNDPLYVKALVLRKDVTTAVLITVDAVAIEEIGPIGNGFLSRVRSHLQKDLAIPPQSVIISASHCHGAVCADVLARTLRTAKEAWENAVPVRAGTGAGHEQTIMENRRVRLQTGKEADVRRAYAFPPDEEIFEVGPIDPEIGILRLDRDNGQCLAMVYNFACHPIMGVPNGGNTADLVGFASKVIEDNMDEGTMAFFLQGCGADINPIYYKDVTHPQDAEPLGNKLGLSTLKTLKSIKISDDQRLGLIHSTSQLPRAHLVPFIERLEAEQKRLLDALKPTTLNLKAFLSLLLKHRLNPDYPGYDAVRYLHEKKMGVEHLAHLDAQNRSHLDAYRKNIHTMEALTRVQTNLNLLKKNHAKNQAAGQNAIDIEMVGLRVGEFILVTFPGELSVQIGLDIKRRSPHKNSYIATVTNGYIYYCPTDEQLKNRGNAQEDSDCLVADGWQGMFEAQVRDILNRI